MTLTEVMQPTLTPGDWDRDAPITCVTAARTAPQALVAPQLPQVFAGPRRVQLAAPSGEGDAPAVAARLMQRRVRALAGPGPRLRRQSEPDMVATLAWCDTNTDRYNKECRRTGRGLSPPPTAVVFHRVAASGVAGNRFVDLAGSV